MELKKLIYTVEDDIAVITMNCLKNLNAIDEQMADELMYVVDAAEKDPEVKVVVLKGAPKAFSAGGDIGYFYDLIQAGGEVNMDGLISKVGTVADGLKRMSKIVITSVCGAAAGAGPVAPAIPEAGSSNPAGPRFFSRSGPPFRSAISPGRSPCCTASATIPPSGIS